MTTSRPVDLSWLQMQLPLAAELFCVAHDERSGRCRVYRRVLGLGLAAGLLADLVMCGRLDISRDGVRVVSLDRLPDGLVDSALSVLVAQPQHREVPTWLAYLGQGAAVSVAEWLAAAGVWRRERRRRFGLAQTQQRYVPADVNVEYWRAHRLSGPLTSGERIGLRDAVLVGLVAAIGLADAVLWDPDTRGWGLDRITAEVDHLPRPLRHLVAFTETAVGDAVLAPH